MNKCRGGKNHPFFNSLLIGDPHRSSFRGDEWYFKRFRKYCRKWVSEHGYELPPWPKYDE